VSRAAAGSSAYRRLTSGERQLAEHPLLEGITALQRLLPLSEARFDRKLGVALAEARRRGTGFFVAGFAARRALGRELWLDIDPAVLERRLEHRFRQDGRVQVIRDRFLGAGDWSPLIRRLNRSTTHREVAEVVNAGFRYRETPSYVKALERARGPKPMQRNFVRLSSPDKVEAYFRQTADMCRSIGELGLMRRSAYGRRLASFASPSVRLPWVEFGELDIGVAIGAEGELYRFASGKHRTAAAQALKLTSIPVEIRLVHVEWLARHMEGGLSPLAALRFGVEALAQAKPVSLL
jgi:hypothetical protein